MSRKEELKAAYKQNWHKLRKMGVYQIKNQANGKILLDASLNLDGAIARDRLWLAKGYHLNSALQQEMKAFGPEAFTLDILETLTPTDDPRDYKEELSILLEVWLENLAPYGDKGYHAPPKR